MEKHQLTGYTDTFSLQEKTITLKKMGLKIQLENNEGELVKLIFSLAHTPKTHYSGYRPIVTMGVEISSEKIFLIEKKFNQDGSNSAALKAALKSDPLISLPPYRGECKVFKLFREQVIDTELCSVKELIPVPSNEFKITFIGKAERDEYIQVMTSLELMEWEVFDKIIFSGWKSPKNLLEEGWELAQNFKYGIFYAKKGDEVDDEGVTNIIESYLQHELGC